jgi:hypothetical protein
LLPAALILWPPLNALPRKNVGNNVAAGNLSGAEVSLLHRIVDEGLACYLNYLYWEERHSPAKNLDFTDEEWDWSIAYERRILDHAAPHLHSADGRIIDQYSHWHQYPWDGTPDRLAYFIGFRICQTFVAKRGVLSDPAQGIRSALLCFPARGFSVHAATTATAAPDPLLLRAGAAATGTVPLRPIPELTESEAASRPALSPLPTHLEPRSCHSHPPALQRPPLCAPNQPRSQSATLTVRL